MTDKLPWLALKAVPGVGLVLFQRLVQHFGGPAAVFEASLAELTKIKGVSPAIAQAIIKFRDWDKMEAQLMDLQGKDMLLLTQDDPRFPPGLKTILYPPPYLFLRGAIHPEDERAVGLVGTRNATYYGLKAGRRLARALAGRGVTVVSGLARGIDTAAHQGALEAGGRTLAVLGCGLDVVYPPENRELYQKIPEQGALISEYPPGTPPEARNFPVRNRLISGLSQALVVVEAPLKSGTQITVRYALDQGREVLAVPGPVESALSLGPHRLIQQGAKLVHDVEDILEELPGLTSASPKISIPRATPLTVEDPLLSLMGSEPIQLDELVQASRLAAPEVMSRLTMLELQGLIRELPGKCYVLED